MVKRVNQLAREEKQPVVKKEGKVKRVNQLAWKVRQAVAKQ
jgi:hypothetical protein